MVVGLILDSTIHLFVGTGLGILIKYVIPKKSTHIEFCLMVVKYP